MTNVNIIAVGKLKESYLREACAEYAKRLGGYCKLTVTELPECRLSKNPSEKEIENALAAEGKAIARYLGGKDAFSVALCIEGTALSSEEFSRRIEGRSALNFVIGSSCGLAPEVKQRCDLRLSMSKMTFPHMLARVMLLEQLYRGFQILEGGRYHK